ncbi:hypothetical protein F5Y14DRAFT_432586 [Nemania sp. NC0429]|nr:hypothetical protein F5Y14DRAFT_432586 [Nemania sp. NC0429]
MATPEWTSCSSRAGWMYTDPYAYQYADLNFDDDMPTVSQGQQMTAAGSSLCELEGSTPADITPRYEPAGSPLSDAVPDGPETPSERNGPCRLSRSRLSNGHASLRYSHRRRHTRDVCAAPAPAPYSPESYLLRASSLGLMPVAENSVLSLQECASFDSSSFRPYRRPSPLGYDDGQIHEDERASTPKERSLDFDTILRNIGSVTDKKGKRKAGRRRSIRSLYDRYSVNFG